MAEKIPMLALSPTMEQGTIVTWVKKEGEPVKSGDILCEVETDKATMEYETSTEGTLLRIIAPEGSKASVGDTIAIIGSEGEDISSLLKDIRPAAKPQAKAPEPKQKKESKEEAKPSPGPTTKPVPTPSPAGRIKASPLARKLAAQLGLGLDAIEGTGPAGRVVERDIIAGAAAHPATAHHAPVLGEAPGLKDETIPLSDKRQVIAKRMSESAFSAPHYYLTISVNMDAIVAARQELKESGQSVSLNAFLLRFVAEALKHNPIVNSTWKGDSIVRHGHADIALAVAQPDGLVAPVVHGCDEKTISQIDSELHPLIDAARAGKLSSEDYAGATFTVSNLGAFEIDHFTAIINPPASAILAVGRMQPTPVVNPHTGTIEPHTMMNLTLSCDHRVIDGAVGAKFLHDLKILLESPALALL